MKKIDPKAYRERLDRITSIFAEMVEQADVQSLTRCPYKDRNDRCTAKFGCRYRRPSDDNGLPGCASDDKLDYRSAWQVDPSSVEEMQTRLREGREQDD